MFFSAGNPVLSVPNGDELEAAIGELELSVAIDLYVTDTARHCDFVLPATTMYEREDFPLPFLALFTTPFIQMTEAVVEPRGEARQEWEVIEEIAARIGVVPSSVLAARLLGKVGIKFSPRRLVEPAAADRAEGRPVRPPPRRPQPRPSWRDNPHGIVLAEHLAPDVLRNQIRHRPRQVRLDPPEILRGGRAARGPKRQRARLPAAADRPARAALAQLVDAQRAAADARRPHPRGADPPRRRRGGRDRRRRRGAGSPPRTARSRSRRWSPTRSSAARSRSRTAGATAAAGHVANAAGGANVNLLASSDPDDLERLAGMAHLNGIPVRLEAVDLAEDGAEPVEYAQRA